MRFKAGLLGLALLVVAGAVLITMTPADAVAQETKTVAENPKEEAKKYPRTKTVPFYMTRSQMKERLKERGRVKKVSKFELLIEDMNEWLEKHHAEWGYTNHTFTELLTVRGNPSEADLGLALVVTARK